MSDPLEPELQEAESCLTWVLGLNFTSLKEQQVLLTACPQVHGLKTLALL